jgi:hypothetical protein
MRHIARVIEMEFSSPKDPFYVLGAAFRFARLEREVAKELEIVFGEMEEGKIAEVVG